MHGQETPYLEEMLALVVRKLGSPCPCLNMGQRSNKSVGRDVPLAAEPLSVISSRLSVLTEP